MANIAALKVANTRRWANAKLTRGPEFTVPAKKALANKATYVDIATRSGMPADAWVFVAVTHYRESSQDFSKNLGQGDPWNEVSTHVPAGRGPFKNFADAAVDALVNCPPYAARNTDWSMAGLLTLLERYNGLAYANAGRPSPYIWSGTDQYTIGKVTKDHGPIEPVVDKQLGCAGLILAIQALDTAPKVIVSPTPAAKPVVQAVPPSPAAEPDFWASIASIISSYFRKA
jgi:lysozyme family protein